MPDQLSFDRILSLDEDALRARLDVVRAALPHAGEKGRALETAVMEMLRSILPAEYGLSTGFIAYHGPGGVQLSTQLDVIVYDAMRCGPLVRLGSCDVFPLEAVYGYVEVKANLRSSSDLSDPAPDSLEACIKVNHKLREFTERRFWESVPGSGVRVALQTSNGMSIRSFVVAFDATGSIEKPSTFAKRMATASAHFGGDTHFHGVLVLGRGFFRTQPVDDPRDPCHYHVQYTMQSPLGAFRSEFLTGMQRFPRFTATQSPALDQYFARSNWLSEGPESAT